MPCDVKREQNSVALITHWITWSIAGIIQPSNVTRILIEISLFWLATEQKQIENFMQIFTKH